MSYVSITGNLVHDIEVKATANGKMVANVTVAENYKANRDADEVVTYIDVTLWEYLAENAARSCHKGDRVIATGRLRQEHWETKEGEKRSKIVIVADSFGPDLRFGTTQYERGATGGTSNNYGGSSAHNERGASRPAQRTQTRQYAFDDEPF